MLRLVFDKGIRPKTKKLLKDYAKAARKCVDIRHRLTVRVRNRATVRVNGKDCFGVFCFPRIARRKVNPTITLCADLRGIIEWASQRKLKFDWAMVLWEVTHTFAHELAHYEQYRYRRKIQERGVEVRARNLNLTIIKEVAKIREQRESKR